MSFRVALRPLRSLLLALMIAPWGIACGAIVDYGTVNGHAMEHTFYDGDFVVVKTAVTADLHRGDIIVFQIEGEGDNFMRRIIALPGETIEIKSGVIIVDGTIILT